MFSPTSSPHFQSIPTADPSGLPLGSIKGETSKYSLTRESLEEPMGALTQENHIYNTLPEVLSHSISFKPHSNSGRSQQQQTTTYY